jgi:hypothetical protein
VRKGNDLTTFIVPKVEKIRKPVTFWIPKGLLRPVAGKPYLYLYLHKMLLKTWLSLFSRYFPSSPLKTPTVSVIPVYHTSYIVVSTMNSSST